MTVLRRAAIAMLISCCVATASAAEPIGIVKVLKGTATVDRGGQRSALALGAPVFQDDRIRTTADGAVGITFRDSSLLSVGPSSTVALDRFSYDPATREGGFDLSLRRGTLAAIAGKLIEQRPGAMKVTTPTAVLAVRGTEFVARVDAAED